MSMSTTSKPPACTAATASAPFAATTTLCPAVPRKARIRYWFAAWSSARSTRSGRSPGSARCPRRLRRGRRGHHPRRADVKAEGAPHPGHAPDRDRAAHQLDDLPRDGEPQPGAAGAARQRAVGLDELLEDAVPVAPAVDADAGVLDLDPERAAVGRVPAGAQADLAAVGELGGVADQVGQHLAQPHRVGQHPLRHRRIDLGDVSASPFWAVARRPSAPARRAPASRTATLSALSRIRRASSFEKSRMSFRISSRLRAEIERDLRAFALLGPAARRASARAARARRRAACGSRGSSRRGSATWRPSQPPPPAGARSAPRCRATSGVTSQTRPNRCREPSAAV